MDDLTSTLTQMLSDPERLESIKQMASSMFGEQAHEKPAPPPIPSLPSDISPEMMGSMVKALSVLKSQPKNDENTAFLMALKPLLSKERAERVDTALKFMRIFRALPALRECGILSMF